MMAQGLQYACGDTLVKPYVIRQRKRGMALAS